MIGENTLVQNRYFVRNLIGRGGMGAVYLAEDTRFNNRIIALKELVFSNDTKFENAFSREANLLAQLQHPRLPKVSDYFNENGRQYLAMEYVPGNDLFILLQSYGKPFPVERVLKWGNSLLEILEYLHSRNPPVLHRDIKPQNLKLNNEDMVILLDFGLAKDTLTHLSRMSSSKSLLGFTIDYAPLEQVRGDRTNEQSDLYSFSATLYQLMTNTAPISSLTRVQAKVDEVSDPLIPPHILNPEVPIGVSELLMQGISLKQESRPQSASEMRQAFIQIMADQKTDQERKTDFFSQNNIKTDSLSQNTDPYLPSVTGKVFTGESDGLIKFQKTAPAFIPQPFMNSGGDQLEFGPKKKSEGNQTFALFGILAAVFIIGIATTFFVGKWISDQFKPAASIQEQPTANTSGQIDPAASGTSNVNSSTGAVKNTNQAPVFEKPVVKPIIPPVQNKKTVNDRKVAEPKPAPENKKPVTAPTIFQ